MKPLVFPAVLAYHVHIPTPELAMIKPPAMFICALFVSISFAQPGSPAPQESKSRFTIDSCVNQFTGTGIESTKVGYQYWFVNRDFLDGRTLKMSVVAPHEASHPPHAHPEDEFFFILEGKAEFYLDGKTRTATPYASFYCPSNMMHGIRNVGDTELKYLVIKKYPRK